MSFLSAAFLPAFLSHQSDFSARVRFCSSLQASLYAAVVDLVLPICNTTCWAWSVLIKETVAPGRWGRTSPGVFGLAVLQYMSWLCCIRPVAELPIPRLVLILPSPPIG